MYRSVRSEISSSSLFFPSSFVFLLPFFLLFFFFFLSFPPSSRSSFFTCESTSHRRRRHLGSSAFGRPRSQNPPTEVSRVRAARAPGAEIAQQLSAPNGMRDESDFVYFGYVPTLHIVTLLEKRETETERKRKTLPSRQGGFPAAGSYSGMRNPR